MSHLRQAAIYSGPAPVISSESQCEVQLQMRSCIVSPDLCAFLLLESEVADFNRLARVLPPIVKVVALISFRNHLLGASTTTVKLAFIKGTLVPR